jgi:hypothetical protein
MRQVGTEPWGGTGEASPCAGLFSTTWDDAGEKSSVSQLPLLGLLEQPHFARRWSRDCS